MRRILFLAFLLLAPMVSLAQFTYFVPDLRWSDECRGYLGLVNPTRTETTVVLTGYKADGTVLGARERALSGWARAEWAAADLFEAGTPAWVSIDAPVLLAGYARYERDKHHSLAPLDPFAGSELQAAQITAPQPVADTQVVLVNTTANQGRALLNPFVQSWFDDFPKRGEEPLALPDFGAPFQQATLRYDSFFDRSKLHLFWDTLHAEGDIQLAAIQHFGDFAGEGPSAALILPRTNHRDMVIAPLLEGGAFETHFQLINTYPTTLPVTLTAYYKDEEPHSLHLELEGFEKRSLTFADPQQLNLPYFAQWYRVTPAEGGLIGFQLFASRDGRSLAAVEGNHLPASELNLPYTPTDERLETTLTVINPTDHGIHFYVAGFDDSGRLVAYKSKMGLVPFQKKVFTSGQLFGEKAESVNWMRVATNDGAITAFALVREVDNQSMAALRGIPSFAREGVALTEAFEQFGMASLLGQGWTQWRIDFQDRKPQFQPQRNHYHDEHNLPEVGQFFMETAFHANLGNLYLGYEPLYNPLEPRHRFFTPDTVSFRSPFFEVPHYGSFYLSYFMRFFDPEFATPTSRFGLMYREEGSNQWTWFGLSGETLLDPPNSIGDCWQVGCYRRRNSEVVYTQWIPFEMKLPDHLRGKRIQIGYYYHYEFEMTPHNGPTYFIDDVSLSAEPLPFSHFFEKNGTGTLIIEE